MRCWRAARWSAQLSRWRLATFVSPSLRNVINLGIDVWQVYWVSPSTIEFCARREFGLSDFKGSVIAGDWDTDGERFTDLDVYSAIRQVCLEGGDWKDTDFCRRFLARVAHGEVLWECQTAEQVEERLRVVRRLFESIKTDGYRTQEQLRDTRAIGPSGEDEVTVCIGRHGELLFSNGAHRLAAAQLLGVPRIPVQVSVSHPRWIAFRQELMHYASNLGGRLYQPALHPTLEGIPAFHQCDDRFRVIRDRLSIRRGTLLDIGANIGYFCHRFEDEGFTCFAAENSLDELYFLRALRTAGNKRFTILNQSVLTCRSVRETKFDVVLALNVFHHFLKTKDSFRHFADMLRHLHTEEMFFQPHDPEDPQMRGAYANLNNEEFVLLVQKNTGLRGCVELGKFLDGRRLFQLGRRGETAALHESSVSSIGRLRVESSRPSSVWAG